MVFLKVRFDFYARVCRGTKRNINMRERCSRFYDQSVTNKRNENITVELVRPAAITFMLLSQPRALISVIFIFNASGTSELCFSYLQASLPRFLRGIRRGSVDAVSDTFRFLPFIFPTHTVTLHGCWWMQLKPASLFIYLFICVFDKIHARRQQGFG